MRRSHFFAPERFSPACPPLQRRTLPFPLRRLRRLPRRRRRRSRRWSTTRSSHRRLPTSRPLRSLSWPVPLRRPLFRYARFSLPRSLSHPVLTSSCPGGERSGYCRGQGRGPGCRSGRRRCRRLTRHLDFPRLRASSRWIPRLDRTDKIHDLSAPIIFRLGRSASSLVVSPDAPSLRARSLYLYLPVSVLVSAPGLP